MQANFIVIGAAYQSGQVFSVFVEITFSWNWNGGLNQASTVCEDQIIDFVVP